MTQNIGLKQKFIDALFGKPQATQQVAPSMSYGEDIDNYLASLPKQSYMQGLYNQPKATGLAPEQIKEGVANGLNFGVPEIAAEQKRLGIAIPKTGEEIASAQIGEFNQPALGVAGVSKAPRQGGILSDLASGYKENATTGLSPNNLAPANKSVATRLGEGLGTLTRFVDSPLGRGALAYGLSNYVGDTNPLEQALTAGLTRQQAKSADEAYRRDLLNTRLNSLQNSNGFANLTPEEQQAKQQAIYDEINGISGNLSDKIYERMQNAQLARDNADYKRMYYDTQLQDNKNLMAYRMMQAQNTADKNAMDNYYKGQQIAQGWKDLDIKANPMNKISNAEKKMLIENKQTLGDIQRGLDMIEKNPNAYSFAKGVLPANVTNRIDPKGVAARTQIDNITAVYRKWLTGAQMSDQERKAYERFLPAPTDNYNIIKAKLQGMKDSIEGKNNVLLQTYGMDGSELGGQTQVQPQTKSKYKVRVIK